MPLFGQVVVGPPGAGKSTYCLGMQMFCNEIGRKAAIVNLDFANDRLPYEPTIDVRKHLTLQDVMDQYSLGPNGGLVFCMEMLLENLHWIIDEIEIILDAQQDHALHYFIFDCPGQVELFSHHSVVQDIFQKLQRELDLRLCSVQLIDSFYCSQPATFISAALLVTSTMLRLELPHVNILSKIDLLKQYGPLPFNLNFFTDMLNLNPLLRYLEGRVVPVEELEAREKMQFESRGEQKGRDDNDYLDDEDDGSISSHDNQNGRRGAQGGRESVQEQKTADSGGDIATGRSMLQRKFHALTSALCEVVDDYALVSFLPLNIEDAETVGRVLAATDRANGYSYIVDYIPKNPTGASARAAAAAANGDQQQRQQQARDYFDYASSQLESSIMMSLEIQEKYGSS